ncbi:hypothetical protein GTP41_20390 [Pseudoduganella sp. DS3]|uniref:DUF6916 domain-containing protein n=1 Tax=Pseudoduganella guangdongensis TaxID=2692179 RepID=A0A6N9HLH8_9BURK|nr:hypothetical protein [Pseudoduganella guangdongensis]MYN04454.1 hypothetical protein [Pseudoduganella guangdongensis]
MSTDVSYFQARLGAVFSVAGAAPELGLGLVLDEVQPSPNPQAFALTFQGPGAPELEQQTVELLREGDAPLAIFLVPAGRNAGGMQYYAVFNN